MSKSPSNVVQMNRSTIVSKYNWSNRKPVWKTKQPSLTIPARAMTLRQIADRFAAGLSPNDQKIALFDENSPVIKDFDKLDLTERFEVIKRAEESLRKKINERQAAQRNAAHEKIKTYVQSEVDKLLIEKQKTEQQNTKPAA